MTESKIWAANKAQQIKKDQEEQARKDDVHLKQQAQIKRDAPRLWDELCKDVKERIKDLKLEIPSSPVEMSDECSKSFSVRTPDKNMDVRLTEDAVELHSSETVTYLIRVNKDWKTVFVPKRPSNYQYKEEYSPSQLAEIILNRV